MSNPMSWNLTPKKGGLLAKVVPKDENNNYVDQLVSIPMGKHNSRLIRYSWDSLYDSNIVVSNLMSKIVILPSLCGKGNSSF